MTLTIPFTDKLSRLLPYQPVYSKEMTEKIEMEEEILRSVNSFDICPVVEYNITAQVRWTCTAPLPTSYTCIQHPMFGCINPSSYFPLESLDKARTNSTFLLKQPNSIEVDSSQLRKTKSAENMFAAPTIVIDKVLTLLFLSTLVFPP
jgi:hypothetical protein